MYLIYGCFSSMNSFQTRHLLMNLLDAIHVCVCVCVRACVCVCMRVCVYLLVSGVHDIVLILVN